jgi:protease-4
VKKIFLRVGIVLLVLFALAAWFAGGGLEIEDGSYVVMDVGGAYVEAAQAPLVSKLFAGAPRPLVSLLSELAKVERDDRLAGVVLRIQPLEVGWGKAQEIRAAIERLRAKERRVIAYLELEKFGANIEYYVASAADEVVVAPGTRNPLVGLAAEYFFFGGLFERIGVDIEYERVGDYKSAVEMFAGSEMSGPARRMANWLLDSIDGQFVSGIASARGIDEDAVRAAIAAAPTTPGELEGLGLIDGARFLDEIVDGLDGEAVEGEDYRSVDPADVGFEAEARIALIYGSGAVVTGEGSRGFRGDSQLAAETVSDALIAASEADDIDAIVLRIDSPGGSALASDLVWRATQRVRAAKIPIIASFSDVAASGGYYVAAGADRIVALPGSITGSIGVFVLRPVLRDLFAKLDIGVATETRGRHADLLLASEPLSAATRARVRADVESVYEVAAASLPVRKRRSTGGWTCWGACETPSWRRSAPRGSTRRPTRSWCPFRLRSRSSNSSQRDSAPRSRGSGCLPHWSPWPPLSSRSPSGRSAPRRWEAERRF